MSGEVVDVKTAALWVAFSEETIRRWCKTGRLAGAYQGAPGGDWRVPTDSLEKIRPCPVWFMPDMAR